MSMIGNFAEVSPEQLRKLIGDPAGVEALLYDEEESVTQIDVDKAWHGIHFLLARSSEPGTTPESRAVLGGVELGDDVGYGPARYLTAEQVGEISSRLSSISVEELRERYDPSVLEAADIYPTGIWKDEGPEAFEYLATYYVEVVRFYTSAAKNGSAVLLYIN